MALHMREANECRDEGQASESNPAHENTRPRDIPREVPVTRGKTRPEVGHQALESVTVDSPPSESRDPQPLHVEPTRSLTSQQHHGRVCTQTRRSNGVLYPRQAFRNQTEVPTCLGSTMAIPRTPFPPEREEIERGPNLASPEVPQLTPVMVETPIRNMLRLPHLGGRRRCGRRLLSRNIPVLLVPHSPNSISVW